MNYLTRISVLILCLLVSQSACADTEKETTTETNTETVPETITDTSESDVDKFMAEMEKKIPSMNVDYVAASPLPGFYEVLTDGQLIYISEDVSFILSGRLFGIQDGIVDLSSMAKERIDMMRAPMRKAKLDRVDASDMILFKAENEKYRIRVFTDVDCGWCRNLHREMANYNERGISVQYLAYPRAGLGSSSYTKLRSVWCSEDRIAAMNLAKLKQEFGADTCEDPISEHLKLVREFGIRGTPALILESGRLVQSFVKPDDLVKLLEQDREATADSPETGTASD